MGSKLRRVPMKGADDDLRREAESGMYAPPDRAMADRGARCERCRHMVPAEDLHGSAMRCALADAALAERSGRGGARLRSVTITGRAPGCRRWEAK